MIIARSCCHGGVRAAEFRGPEIGFEGRCFFFWGGEICDFTLWTQLFFSKNKVSVFFFWDLNYSLGYIIDSFYMFCNNRTNRTEMFFFAKPPISRQELLGKMPRPPGHRLPKAASPCRQTCHPPQDGRCRGGQWPEGPKRVQRGGVGCFRGRLKTWQRWFCQLPSMFLGISMFLQVKLGGRISRPTVVNASQLIRECFARWFSSRICYS